MRAGNNVNLAATSSDPGPGYSIILKVTWRIFRPKVSDLSWITLPDGSVIFLSLENCGHGLDKRIIFRILDHAVDVRRGFLSGILFVKSLRQSLTQAQGIISNTALLEVAQVASQSFSQ